MMAITTNNSTSVNPRRFRFIAHPREKMMMRGTSGCAADKTPKHSHGRGNAAEYAARIAEAGITPKQFRGALYFIPASNELQ